MSIEKINDILSEENNKITWLFLKSKKGDKVQTWGIENLGDGSYRTHSGDVGGKITISAPTFCEAKNIGKKNETGPHSQCILEVAAKIQKKRDKGYGDNSEGEERPFVPTLAKVFKDHKKKIKYPAYASPKLDGMRCILTKDGMFSRERNEIFSAPHIKEQFVEFFETNPEAIIDGELYADKHKCDFEKIMSLVKQQTPTQEELDESRENIEYHIFDIVAERSHMNRLTTCQIHFGKFKYIKIVPHHRVESEEEIKNWHGIFVSQLYEGTMVRWGNDGYILDRTDKLLKYKDFIDGEFLVSRLLSGRGKTSDTIAKWELFMPNGVDTFEAGVSGTNEFNQALYDNRDNIEKKKYITIKYQEVTREGKPRFANFVAVRDFR